MGDTYEPETVLRLLLRNLSTPAEKEKFRKSWTKSVDERVAAWKKTKDNKSTSTARLRWEAEIVEYVTFLHLNTRGKDGVAIKLSPDIPLYGPRFSPPTYMHQMRRNPTCSVAPETTYELPITVVHPVFYPNRILDACPQCGSSDILWDSWNATGARNVQGLSKNERAIGYQLRCKTCRDNQPKTKTKDTPGYCFSTVSAAFWAKWEHWKIPHEIPCFHYHSAVTRELFDLLIELRPSQTSAGLSESIKQLHLLRYHKDSLNYLSYFQTLSAKRNFFTPMNLQKISAPDDHNGYDDKPISNDSITDLYLEFVDKTRQLESIRFCQTRSAVSLSLDNTFKSAGKAVVVEKDKSRRKLFKGGILSIINENSETLIWRFCQSASPSEIGEALKDIKSRHEFLEVEEPKIVVVDNCCQVRRFITEQLPNTRVVLDVFHFVQRGILNGSKNPHHAAALRDISAAIIEQMASKGKPAMYYPKDVQEKRLVEAYDKWAEKGVWSAAGTKIHEDQLAHVKKGCLERGDLTVATDGSRIESSHKGWNSLQRAYASGLEVYSALGHDFVHRRNIRIATSKAEKGSKVNLTEFLASTYGSHHTCLINHIASTWNQLLGRESANTQAKLTKAIELPTTSLDEKFGLVVSPHTTTFGGLIKEEEVTDENRLLSELDEMSEELDEGRFYQTLGVKRHLFHIPAKRPAITHPTTRADTCPMATETSPGRKRKDAPEEVQASSAAESSGQANKRIRRLSVSTSAVSVQGTMDQFLGIIKESTSHEEQLESPIVLTASSAANHICTDIVTPLETASSSKVATGVAINESPASVNAVKAAQPAIAALANKSMLTRSQALFALSTEVDPRSLGIGRGQEFYLFMDMRAEHGWVSYSMSSARWVAVTKAYNKRLEEVGKSKNVVMVRKNPRALMEKLAAVELDICHRIIKDDFIAKSSGSDIFWKKHCFAVPALLKTSEVEKRSNRKPPSCGRCHTIMYPGAVGSPENHKKGYCADGVRQKPKPESKDASLPKWPQPAGIFSSGKTFNCVKFLEYINSIYEKIITQSPSATSLADLELSLEETSFVEMLQSRITVTADGVYFRLYDFETIRGGSLVVEREQALYLRVDYLSE